MRFLFVCLGLWLTLLPLQSKAQEIVPGNACSVNGAVTHTSGLGTDSHQMICIGGTWNSIYSVESATSDMTVQGNLTVTGTCTGCGGGGSSDLLSLTDTNITSPADASLLIYDTGTSMWRDALMSGDVTINDTGVAVVADNSHNHTAANITSGTMATARLGSGTANATAVLLGNSTWAQLSSLTVGTATNATTATTANALAANGSNCPAGQYARGVSATGAAENCTAIPTGVTTLAGLDDTAITSPANGHILVYNNTLGDWVNVAMSGDVTISTTGVTTVANNSHTHTAANITSGVMATARLGSGTASASTYLRGDSTWAALPTDSDSQTLSYNTTSHVLTISGGNTADLTGTVLSGDVTGNFGATVVANDSHTHDGRYYTEAESNANYVNVTGDAMSGALTVQGHQYSDNASGDMMLTPASGGYIDFRTSDPTHGLIIRDSNGGGTAWSGIRTTDAGVMQLKADGAASYAQLQLLDNGNISASGTITASAFSGNGSGLTNVSASSVAWGNVSGRPAHTTATPPSCTATSSKINWNGSAWSCSTSVHADDLVCTDCIGTTEIADSYVLNTGDEITGALTIDSSADQSLIIDGNSTGNPYIRFQQAGTNRGYLQYVNGTILRMNNGSNSMDLTTSGLDMNDLDVFDVRYVRYDSDERKKRDITPIDGALEKIRKINGVTYFWKDEFASEVSKDKLHIGLIAQDVEAVFPELVSEDSNGYKDVVYAHLIAPAIQAIKEVWSLVRGNTSEIEASKARIAELENKVETLLVRLNELETLK